MSQSSRFFFEVLHKSREGKDNALFLLKYGRLVGTNKVLKLREELREMEIRGRETSLSDPGAMDAAADMREGKK